MKNAVHYEQTFAKDEIILNETKATKNWFARHAEAEAEKGIPYSHRVVGIAIVVFSVLMVLYFVAHQTWSTGFFTATFGTLEMLMLYGSLMYWIITCTVLLFGFKNLSRDFDSFGGLIFVTVGVAWLFVVFPFDFAYFADVLPDSLRFLVQWISNDVARVLMVLGIIVHLGAAFYCPIGYKFVVMKRSKREKIYD